MDAIGESIARIEVKRKQPRGGLVGKIGLYTFKMLVAFMGVIGLIMGLLSMVTIIGIIPGFFMSVGSIGLILPLFARQLVKCPHCEKRNTVLVSAEDFKCKRCENPVIIEWTK